MIVRSACETPTSNWAGIPVKIYGGIFCDVRMQQRRRSYDILGFVRNRMEVRSITGEMHQLYLGKIHQS